MRQRTNRYFVADFETTVYKGQKSTEVWASACVEIGTEDVHIFHSIVEQFDYFFSLNSHLIVYFHNLKFDGSFMLSYFLLDLGLEQATQKISDACDDIEFIEPKYMHNGTFSYSISSLGQWYRIIIKNNDRVIEIRDSLKLLPFSVEKIGKSFKTKHKKLSMEYTGFRYPGCEISEEEQKYIANDVLVIKEAIEIMFTEGHKRLTIGSCCLAEYKKIMGKTYNRFFPNMYDVELDKCYCAETAGHYIKKSYHGGWCYLADGKERKIYKNGTTADVNSLYPSMMHSESGNMYPIGEPTFWSGNYIPDIALDGTHYYFLRIKTRFYLKDGKLPFIQLKGNFGYKPTEMLKTSDIYNPEDGKYYASYYDIDGNYVDSICELTMTMTDFRLLCDHYDLKDFEILDGCYFSGAIGIFDEYINKYREIKMNSTGAQRELAKLFLNNLYGKMASSTTSNFKIAHLKEDKTIGFYTQLDNSKEPGYIPVGSAITSYSRNFTIRAAQANYYGPDKPGFIYADTDSIHCDLPPEDMRGITFHDAEFCKWKAESRWDIGYFLRQKSYIEHITHENLQPVENPYYNIKCAGMPEKCKKLFLKSLSDDHSKVDDGEQYTKEEIDFLQTKREITDFDIGLKVPGKLLPKRIIGGIVLVDSTYQIR